MSANPEESVRGATVYSIAHAADVYLPDSDNSPGAEWLRTLRDAAVETFDLDDNGGEVSDTVSQMLAENEGDAPYVIGTHRAWSVFVDLGAYNEDLTDLGYESIPANDLSKAVDLALYQVAERVLYGALEALAQEAETED